MVRRRSCKEGERIGDGIKSVKESAEDWKRHIDNDLLDAQLSVDIEKYLKDKVHHPMWPDVLMELTQTHVNKCRDYGLDNLYRYGPGWQIMRIIDKVSRLENWMKGLGAGVNPREELKDLAVMSILAIGLMDQGIPMKKYDIMEGMRTCPLCQKTRRRIVKT